MEVLLLQSQDAKRGTCLCTCLRVALLLFLTPEKMADAISKKVSFYGAVSSIGLPCDASRPKLNNLSRCSASRLPIMHSTPKKVEKVQDLDSTQYLQLDINTRHFAIAEKNCSKCMLFKGSDATRGLILQLENVKRYLERDTRHLAKTRKCMMQMCKSNEDMRLGLSQHQEEINQINLRLSTVTNNLTSFIEKEEAFFEKFLKKR